ncbi:unnamed protein product [Cylindrotheca closterium]|uniref:Uncharacterized protein n=1 Tax=Cylindrotheca closterium TaxID=2856 RepID=A0AAD2CV23_9STRA|nr:unnamed protein product [Cylindrotheca closterium]
MIRLTFLLVLYHFDDSIGFLLAPESHLRHSIAGGNVLMAKKQSETLEVTGETPAGIVGAEFFGGNKEKDEFYVQAEEDSAAIDTDASFNRFFVDPSTPSLMFDSLLSAKLAHSLQSQINNILYEKANAPNVEYGFATDMIWESPMRKGRTSPFAELEDALDFYKNVDLAIVSGKQLNDNTLEFQWELSVVWPALWSPRVHLVGTSVCKLDGNNMIFQQTDKLMDDADLVGLVSSQIKPRFWDFYHIGMTPSAECTPKLRFQRKWGYQVYEIPPRLVTSPSMVETGTREDYNAETVPNHAFSCIIKTMGPNRQRYVPTSPVEVQIIPGDDQLQFKWTIPLAAEFLKNTELPLAGTDKETDLMCDPQCKYEFHQRRKIATINYGGNPQDTDIADARKRLYEKVITDGLKPKLGENGRPIFFFIQNNVKACFTSEGLGMCVYEYRSKATKPDEIGIELESQ